MTIRTYRTLILLSILVISVSTGCKTKAPAKFPDVVVGTTETDNPELGQALVADSIDCRLRINFISTGAGINNEARLTLERFQMKYAMDHNLPMKPRRLPRGREGEVEYCYPMYGFSDEEAEDFISKLKEILGNEPLVFITENTKQALY